MSPPTVLAVVGAALLLVVGGQALPRLSDNADPQIIGGDETTIDKYPYQIVLFYYDRFRCGGSILNSRFILTAAHCLQDVTTPTKLSIRAGSSLRESGGQFVSAAKMAYDKRFTMNKMRYDVGIIKLEKDLVLNDMVRPVELVAAGAEPKTGQTITLTGWGDVKEGVGRGASKLRTVDVTVKNRFLCSIPYFLLVRLSDEMFCAAASGKDSCQGDSGGPAVNEEGKQAGIVSFGVGCAKPFFNGVYTNIANKEVRAFIDNALQTM